jgi:hypothetical protein
MAQLLDDGQLILAAEDCSEDDFDKLHKFLEYEERLIRNLMAHGPVLLRGGRGSGKSALLMEAHKRLRSKPEKDVLSIYLSLRHLPLLRSSGEEYHKHFCKILISAINRQLADDGITAPVDEETNQDSLREKLVELTKAIQRRLVLFFDDAAHIGRETDLSEFFDLFRTLSGSTISCKAAIYPGVTKFGTRFDVYNDATVIDIARDERAPYFPKFFIEVMKTRYPRLLNSLTSTLTSQPERFATFLGRSVLGNMRSFIFTCNTLSERVGSGTPIGLPELTNGLIFLAADYYWPLLEELKPKLGIYESMIDPSRQVAEMLFEYLGRDGTTSFIVHRDIQQKLAKPLEILEYVGFISKREASRGMKSGGRGSRYAVIYCNLLEKIQGKRITQAIYDEWIVEDKDPTEIHSSSSLLNVAIPELALDKEMAILGYSIATLRKSKVYPYGLTDAKYIDLLVAGYNTIADLALATDEELKNIDGIGDKSLKRIRNVVYQAIWM